MNGEKRDNVKFYIRTGATLLIICAVTAALLAFVNALTKDRIAENELSVVRSAIDSMFDGADDIKLLEKEYESPISAVYEAYKDGEIIGYGVQASPFGFKEAIGLIVGVDMDGVCIGVEVTSISDTPGVGTKVKDSVYLGGYVGRDYESAVKYDAISGATISSEAVREGVAAALSLEMFKTEDDGYEPPSLDDEFFNADSAEDRDDFMGESQPSDEWQTPSGDGEVSFPTVDVENVEGEG